MATVVNENTNRLQNIQVLHKYNTIKKERKYSNYNYTRYFTFKYDKNSKTFFSGKILLNTSLSGLIE